MNFDDGNLACGMMMLIMVVDGATHVTADTYTYNNFDAFHQFSHARASANPLLMVCVECLESLGPIGACAVGT